MGKARNVNEFYKHLQIQIFSITATSVGITIHEVLNIDRADHNQPGFGNQHCPFHLHPKPVQFTPADRSYYMMPPTVR